MIKSVLAKAILAHDLPFSFVEYDKIHAWVEYLIPCAEIVSRNTIVSDIEKIYDIERIKLKEIIGRIPIRICLTLDVWTTTISEGYVCSVHFRKKSK
jgi:hypothetical protein